MKYSILSIIAIILFSCSFDSTIEKDDNINQNENDSIALENTSNIDDEANLAVQENSLTIEDFPKTWYMLNPKEEGSEELVINKWCEAETQQLQIKKEGADWFVYVLLGQDGMKYKVIDFDAYEEERELYQVMYGTFVLENPSYPDADPEIYEYMWNKDLMFCHFDGFFSEGSMLVSEQNKDNYELIEENCDYLHDM